MKIYNCIIMDMSTWEVLYEDSYKYGGPIALCGGGGQDYEAPPVDPNVTRMNALNAGLMEQSVAQNAQLRPYQLQAMGLKETPNTQTPEQAAEYNRLAAEVAAYDASPNREPNAMAANLARMKELNPSATLSKMSDEEYYASLSPTEKQSYDLQKLAYERTKQAYEGTLPISPAMEKELAQQKGITEEGLRRRLGSNWNLSTSGIQSMGDFNTNAELAREEARRGQITSGEGILLARQGFGSGLTQQNYQNYTGYPQSTLGISSGLVNATQPYLNYANMQNQANIANAQAANQSRSGLMSGLGTMAGLAGGIGLASMTGGASIPLTAAAGGSTMNWGRMPYTLLGLT